MKKIKAVVFDLDGTLSKTWRIGNICEELGIHFTLSE